MRYAIAVRRHMRPEAPGDWPDRVLALSGVTLLGRFDSRLTVEMDRATAAKVRALVGKFCHVEELVERDFGD